jgi:hypothetical protein
MPKEVKIKTSQHKSGHNGKGTRAVKDYHKGTIAKNSHDVASKNVHKKYGITGDGPKKVTRARVKH